VIKGEFYTVETVYKNKEKMFRFFGRYEDKTKMTTTLKAPKPYFYAKSEECAEGEPGFVSLYGEPLTKITYYDYKSFEDMKRDYTTTYEADVNQIQRFLIDKDIYTSFGFEETKVSNDRIEVEPKVWILDIETEYYGGSNKDMSKPITCISWYDNYEKELFTLAYKHTHDSIQDKTFSYESVVKDKKGTPLNITCREIVCKDETTMLLLFAQLVEKRDLDIFTGWNVHFDMTYILKRMEDLRLNPAQLSPVGKYYFVYNKLASQGYNRPVTGDRKEAMIRGRAIVDLLKGYKRLKWKQISSFRLDAIGKNEFKIGKMEYDGWIGDFWKVDFDNFLKYNRRDVEICIAINNQYSIIDFLLNVRRITGCELSDVHYNSRMIDVYILRKCRGKFVLPTRKYKPKGEDDDDDEKIEGGFVSEPIVGVHSFIAALDMKSLYPSIMLSMNMSPETVSSSDGEIKLPNGVYFKKQQGILKEILQDLLKKRDDIRAKLKTPEVNQDKTEYLRLYKYQYAYKTFTNSLYGVTLYSSFRLFDSRIGASITFTGRYISHKINDLCQLRGFPVVRQDTDSAFVDFKAKSLLEAIEKGRILEEEINSMFDDWFAGWGCDTSYFKIKMEKVYETLFSGAEKKLYTGKIVWDWEKGVLKTPEVEIKGFAAKRSDRSLFSHILQETVFDMIFAHKTKQDILKYVYSEVDKFLRGEYDYEVIGIPKAITRDPDEYAVDNPWIRGIRYSEKHIRGYQFSPKPYLLYVKDSETDVICFDSSSQVPQTMLIDWEKMLRSTALNVLKNVFPTLGIDVRELEYYIQNKCTGQKRLDSYGL